LRQRQLAENGLEKRSVSEKRQVSGPDTLFKRPGEQGREIIKIEVQGNVADDRKYVLREICQQLELIHRRSFPSLKFIRKIPCNCEDCGQGNVRAETGSLICFRWE
jgi:hypothetical protein